MPHWALDAPDRLVYSSNATGKWELYTWDHTADLHRQATDRPEGTLNGLIDRSGEWLWWFNDEKGNELGRWMAQPFAGGEPRVVAPELPPFYPSGLAVSGSLAVVGSSTVEGHAIHVVRDGGPPKLLYHHREAAQVAGLSRDEQLLCISHAEHGDRTHPALRVIDLEGQTIADLSDGPGRGLWAAGWSRVRGDRRLLVIHERGDMNRPLVWTPETGEVVEPAIDLPGDVVADWYPDASALLLLHRYRGRDELYRFDLAEGGMERIEVEQGTILSAGVRPDGEVWYHWSSSATPAEVRVDGKMLLRPEGEPAPGGVRYSDYDVGGVHGFLAEPAGARPHPTIFYIHGGPTGADWDYFSPPVQAWVDHGYAVVLVNYRGSTGYGRAWRDALQGSPGFTELEDIAKVHDWVRSQRIAQPERTVLAGASWGGYLTLLGLGRQPERWSLGIAAVPLADCAMAYEDAAEPLRAYDRALFGGPPEELPDLYRERSPITYVEQVRVPVMVLAGENDPRCPIRQIDSYISRLQELGKPHDVYRYDAGHASLVTEEVVRQVAAQLAFAALHLGTPPPQ
jgi:acetyl esterase/lipase